MLEIRTNPCHSDLGRLRPETERFGAFVMSGGDAVLTTDTEPEQAEDFVDDFLRLCGHIRASKHRDPLRALEDALLDLRVKVG